MSAGAFALYALCLCAACFGVAWLIRWLCPPIDDRQYYLWMEQCI